MWWHTPADGPCPWPTCPNCVGYIPPVILHERASGLHLYTQNHPTIFRTTDIGNERNPFIKSTSLQTLTTPGSNTKNKLPFSKATMRHFFQSMFSLLLTVALVACATPGDSANDQPTTSDQPASTPDANSDSAADNASDTTHTPRLGWQQWSPNAVDDALDSDRPAFVAFTAEWDITSKTNRHNVLQTEKVREAMTSCDVATFRADWTDGDDQIRSRLAELGYDGVPLYVVYSSDAPDKPHILPQVLSVDVVLHFLQEVAHC